MDGVTLVKLGLPLSLLTAVWFCQQSDMPYDACLLGVPTDAGVELMGTAFSQMLWTR